MDLCDRVGGTRDGPRDCMRAIKKRLFHQVSSDSSSPLTVPCFPFCNYMHPFNDNYFLSLFTQKLRMSMPKHVFLLSLFSPRTLTS